MLTAARLERALNVDDEMNRGEVVDAETPVRVDRDDGQVGDRRTSVVVPVRFRLRTGYQRYSFVGRDVAWGVCIGHGHVDQHRARSCPGATAARKNGSP